MVIEISGNVVGLKNIFSKKKGNKDSVSFESVFTEKSKDAEKISSDHEVSFGNKFDISDRQIDNEKAAKIKAKESGRAILYKLEEVRNELLDGGIDPEKISSLGKESDVSRKMIFDPTLNDILDQIELRAAVESAKLDQKKELV